MNIDNQIDQHISFKTRLNTSNNISAKKFFPSQNKELPSKVQFRAELKRLQMQRQANQANQITQVQAPQTKNNIQMPQSTRNNNSGSGSFWSGLTSFGQKNKEKEKETEKKEQLIQAQLKMRLEQQMNKGGTSQLTSRMSHRQRVRSKSPISQMGTKTPRDIGSPNLIFKKI